MHRCTFEDIINILIKKWDIKIIVNIMCQTWGNIYTHQIIFLPSKAWPADQLGNWEHPWFEDLTWEITNCCRRCCRSLTLLSQGKLNGRVTGQVLIWPCADERWRESRKGLWLQVHFCALIRMAAVGIQTLRQKEMKTISLGRMQA